MSLAHIVKLYRKIGKPPITKGGFSKEISFSNDVLDALRDVRDCSPNSIRELLFDDVEVLPTDPLPESSSNIEIDFQFPTSSSEKFYESVLSLLSEPSTSRGALPSKYYLISDDYFNEDEGARPPQLVILERICVLISSLSSLAHYHDDKIKNDHFKLVFVQPDKEMQHKPTVIETKIEEAMLEVESLDISIVESLCSASAESDPHYTAKIGVLWNTLSEFILLKGVAQPLFSCLVMNWPEFVSAYQQNLATYISGFAFHKAKKEVAEAELAMAEKFSAVLSDITGKLFSIPVSFTALIAVGKLDSPFESLIVTLGLLLASLVVAGSVGNQQRQFERIRHAKAVMFEAIDGKKEEFPEVLDDAISNMKEGLNSNENKLLILLWSFRAIAWLPVIVGVIVYVYLYG